MKKARFDSKEYWRELESAIESGAVKSIPNLARVKKELAKAARCAREARERATPVSIRVKEQDLALLRERAAAEGLPYQAVIKSLIHKYVANRE